MVFLIKIHACRLMVLKISSKFELRRFCRTTGSVAMVCFFIFHFIKNLLLLYLFFLIFVFILQLKLSRPNPDDLGYVDSVSVEEIGGARVCLNIWFLLYSWFISCMYPLLH